MRGITAFGVGIVTSASIAFAGSNFEIPSYSIDSGGGMISGGTFTLVGSIGQPDAGPTLSGSTFTLQGGFLAGSPVVPNCPGDVNGDNMVNFADLDTLLDRWDTATAPNTNGDLDGDGFVSFADLNILLDRWDTSCP